MQPTAAISTATSRIAAVASHLSDRPATAPAADTATGTMAAAPKRPPITCHILDTTTGTPAPDVSCTLTLLRPASQATEGSSSSPSFHALTNDDGRVARWEPAGDGPQRDLDAVVDRTQQLRWRLTFEVGRYFSGKGVAPFFDKVDVHFVTGGPGQEGREHYHVPLLVGPFNYTTYRGS